MLEDIKELTETRKELGQFSKSFSAELADKRNGIKEITLQKKLLKSLQKAEKTVEENKEKLAIKIEKHFI